MHCTSVTASGDSRSTVPPFAHRRRHARAAHALDRGGEFATVAGEQHELIAAAHAQHLGEMGGGAAGSSTTLPGAQAAST